MLNRLSRYLPILEWGRSYNGTVLTNDLVAAIIVTIMLIPQSLAYALLAGLPPVVGLYASILPLIAYAIFGTSRTLAVGPVAVLSRMTASAAGAVATPGSPEYIEAAMTLAALSGIMLTVLGWSLLGDGSSERASLFRLAAPTALASAVIANTPLVAGMAPMVRRWAERDGRVRRI